MLQRPRGSTPTPFYSVAGRREGTRKLLLLTYSFPPDQVAGALRWQKFAEFLAEAGWVMDVVTLDPKSIPEPDWRRLDELPAGTRVYGVEVQPLRVDFLIGLTLKGIRAIARRFKGLFTRATSEDAPTRENARPGSLAVSDIRWTGRNARELIRAYAAWREIARARAWARAAARVARQVAAGDRHRAVISSGPPHMVHVEASRLARQMGVPFLMDMRDPWSLAQRLSEFIASPVWLRLSAHYERACVGSAAVVLANTSVARDAMRDAYPAATARIITVMNGCDHDWPSGSVHGDRFVLAYSGTIYHDRNPAPLFSALAPVVRELGLSREEFGIEFLCPSTEFDGVDLLDLAREAGLPGYVSVHAPLPRLEALAWLSRATMLFILPQDTQLIIPAKVFEYAQFDAWMLALAGPGSAVAHVLEGSGADIVDPRDLSQIAAAVRQRILQFRRGERPTPIEPLVPITRRHQASLLISALNACAGTDAGVVRWPSGADAAAIPALRHERSRASL